jgi:hypothetical protein
MKKIHALLCLVAAPAFAWELPDAVATPGAINAQVTQANIHTTICVPGWTKTIRPPASYTNRLKGTQLAAGVYASPQDLHTFEEDHLVSLEIGGHPTDPRNLWPQPWDGKYGAHAKDQLENFLHRAVCSGTVTLADAQAAVASNWIIAYDKYVKKSTSQSTPEGERQ